MDTHTDWPTPWPITTYTVEDARNLIDLFDVADEVYDSGTDRPLGPLTLDDLDPAFVARARAAADKYKMAWPPHLPEVEEYFNDHGNAIKAAIR